MHKSPSRPGRASAGFTLIEILIVFAVIGLVASIAIPIVTETINRARRNAAVNDMRVLYDGLLRYHVDIGHYPPVGSFDKTSLAPLVPNHLAQAEAVLRNFVDGQLDIYIPFNPFGGSILRTDFLRPHTFLIVGRLKIEPTRRVLITDEGIFFLDGSRPIPTEPTGGGATRS